jgi:secreted PhoX family phosphatase
VPIERRRFLRYLGAGTAGLTLGSTLGPLARPALALPFQASAGRGGLPFSPIAPSTEDDLVLPPGFEYQVVRAWGDRVTAEERFGFNCDFTAFFPLANGSSSEGLLWVNHEYASIKESNIYTKTFPQVFGRRPTIEDLKTDLGGSVLHIRRDAGKRRWEFVEGSRYNRRITGSPTARPQRLDSDGPVVADVFERHNVDGLGRRVLGTFQNCAGGQTPWGTVLSCEENFQDMAPEAVDAAGRGTVGPGRVDNFGVLGSKYGWVIEIDPFDAQSVPVKHTALGRLRHEGVGLWAKVGEPVVCYMGEDRARGHVWKFVSRNPYRAGAAAREQNKKLLSEGKLYVARFAATGEGEWIAVNPDTPVAPVKGARLPEGAAGARKLGDYYASLGAILTDGFHVGNLAGGTPMPNPEDIEVHPLDSSVYIAITLGGEEGSPLFPPSFGQIWRLVESADAPRSTTFRWERFSAGGGLPGSGGYAQPDNLLFDSGGNLWVATDIYSAAINNPKSPAGRYSNNGLFVIPTAGPEAGKAVQFASGPCEVELTGPSFTPDEQTLFLSVQHPGEEHGIRDGSTVIAPRGSNWPARKLGTAPRPSVVAVTKR